MMCRDCGTSHDGDSKFPLHLYPAGRPSVSCWDFRKVVDQDFNSTGSSKKLAKEAHQATVGGTVGDAVAWVGTDLAAECSTAVVRW